MKFLLSDDVTTAPKFQVMLIVGMGGVGKTTLPQIIYNDEEVKKKFQIRGWACVSDPFHPEAITRQILESISGRSFYSQSIPTEWALGRWGPWASAPPALAQGRACFACSSITYLS